MYHHYDDEDLLDDEIIKLFLDDYSRSTAMPIGLYSKERATFSAISQGCFSGFCAEFRKMSCGNKACEDDHRLRALEYDDKPITSSLKLCHAGLWNIAYPILVDGAFVATLLCGQRLMIGHEIESEDKFLKRAQELNIPEKKTKELLNLLLQTPKITKSDFMGEDFKNLQKIGQYIYKLALSGQRSIELESRITSLAHEFLLPMQAIFADASNLLAEIEKGNTGDQQFLIQTAQKIKNTVRKLHIVSENMRNSFLVKKYEPTFSLQSIYIPLIKCWETYRSEAVAKDIELRKPICSTRDFPIIEMSPPDLERAFMNLIGNAVKYSFRGDEEKERYIEIMVEYNYPFCSVSISNYGVGILSEEINTGRIFEQGYRGKLSSDRHRTGSGLGLSEAKKIIEEIHGGKIIITSIQKSLGSGYKTTVVTKIPFSQKNKGG